MSDLRITVIAGRVTLNKGVFSAVQILFVFLIHCKNRLAVLLVEFFAVFVSITLLLIPNLSSLWIQWELICCLPL